jgi:phosphoserine aminotransferase
MEDKLSLEIPQNLLPKDKRFGSGPSKVRLEALESLYKTGTSFMGTSHRQPGVKNVIAEIKTGLKELFNLPDDYEILLGNGGATAFWDAASFCLIEKKSQHLVFGEFSSKFAEVVKNAPHLDEPEIIASPYGTHPDFKAADNIDFYALTENETSTGVYMEVIRPKGALANALVAVDATSSAGAIAVDPKQFDVYYFSPQKCFSSDGGLFLAIVSPLAIQRINTITSSRWCPAFLDLKIALDNSRQNQTYNTPALATLWLLKDQINWILQNGGLNWAFQRVKQSSEIIYTWAENSEFAEPFVKNASERSPVVTTIDFIDPVDAKQIALILRTNGILDVEPYRKLGRNQLRIAVFPSVDPEDVSLLLGCINYIVGALY